MRLIYNENQYGTVCQILFFLLMVLIFDVQNICILSSCLHLYAISKHQTQQEFTKSNASLNEITCVRPLTFRLHPVLAAGHSAEERARPLLREQLRVQPLVRRLVADPQLHLQQR